MVKEGAFREDLFYRLNVVVMRVLPLRERKEDIPLLVDHFLDKFARENGKDMEGISSEARDLLIKYDYPGNVRELENIMERAVVIARDPHHFRRRFAFQRRYARPCGTGPPHGRPAEKHG